VSFDIIYAGEIFANTSAPAGEDYFVLTGHLDLALTLDFEKMGFWPGGKFYVLGQNNHGRGLNELVGSTSEVSNIEAVREYTQLGEFFLEQSLFDDRLVIRLGKQDANREFGTPRFGGNFINNNFGLIPSTPFPSYPTNGLGATVVVRPTDWLTLKAMIIEGKPQIGSFGFDTAFVKDAGHILVVGAAVKHKLGKYGKTNGTSSLGAFRQQGPLPVLGDGAIDPMTGEQRMVADNYGFYAQHDERIYLDPNDKDDPRCFTWITRVGWAQPDRTLMNFFVGSSLAYHGFGPRQDDTVGIGFGYMEMPGQVNGTPGRGAEFFVELFYKVRFTHFFSLQPDLQYYRTPGGDGRDAVLVGLRVKFKG
jgi:porin